MRQGESTGQGKQRTGRAEGKDSRVLSASSAITSHASFSSRAYASHTGHTLLTPSPPMLTPFIYSASAPLQVSQHCQNFIRSLLRQKPEFRLGSKGGAAELRQHRFLTSGG